MDHVRLQDRESVEAMAGVTLTTLAVGAEMSIQHLSMEPGAEIPEHDHPHEQVGFVYEGAQTFQVDGATHVVEAGESYAIPGGEPHAVANRGDDVLLAIDVFSPPRPDPAWMD